MPTDTIDNDVTMPGGSGTLLANRFRIVKQLGQGGMGSVWLAEDIQLDNKQFAIKMLPSILVSNKRAYAQLKSEALVAMKLTHPNIVTLRAFEENNGNPFLVMDYIDGETLDDYLAECGDGFSTQRRRDAECAEVGDGRVRSPSGPQSTCLPESEVVRILKPIAAALDYAHSKGVVHRDVKPGNVMIAKDGTPYILDFGIAREIQETVTRVTGKLSSGTLLYMSPEQLNGDAPKPAQDIYSLAAMAYECLKGEPPFSRGNIEFQIMNRRPEPLVDVSAAGSLSVGVNGQAARSTSIAASVMAGLAKKPEDRPTTCSAVIGGGCSDGVSPSRNGGDAIATSHVGTVGPLRGCSGGVSPSRNGGDAIATSHAGTVGPLRGCSGGVSPSRVGKLLAVIALFAALVGGVWWWNNGNGNGGMSEAAEEPVAEEPVTKEPVTEEPVTGEPVAKEPVTEEPGCLPTNGVAGIDVPSEATAEPSPVAVAIGSQSTNETVAVAAVKSAPGNEPRRKKKADDARAAAMRLKGEVMGKGVSFEADGLLSDSWSNATNQCATADAEYGEGEYDKAAADYNKARGQFDKILERIKEP